MVIVNYYGCCSNDCIGVGVRGLSPHENSTKRVKKIEPSTGNEEKKKTYKQVEPVLVKVQLLQP